MKFFTKNIYHRQLSVDIEMQDFKIKNSGRSPRLTKLVLILLLKFHNFVENFYNTIQYIIFQYGLEQVLIQWKLIGCEAILEKNYIKNAET